MTTVFTDMNFRIPYLCVAGIILALMALGTPLLTTPTYAQSSSGTFVQQPQPTVAPTTAPSPTAAPRKRLEEYAPPLRPQAAAVLIGANVALAVALVVFSLLLRRRRLRRESEE